MAWWAVFERKGRTHKWKTWGAPRHNSELSAIKAYCDFHKMHPMRFEQRQKDSRVSCRRLEPTPPLPE